MQNNYEQPRGFWTEPEARENYRKYERTYRAAEALAQYLYERWRSDSVQYHYMMQPFIDSKFGIIQERA